MSCAQVMYQPYASSPYVVQPETPQPQPPPPPQPQPQPVAAATTTTAAPTTPATTPQQQPQPPPPSITPTTTPPHAHHHHHHHQPHHHPHHHHHHHQPNESASGSGNTSNNGLQQQQQQQGGGASDLSTGRGISRVAFRAGSNGSATDPDAPPPEKKFCVEAEVPPAPPTPSLPPPPHHHQAHHHHQPHHHHHHHTAHHHPPHSDPPPGSPSTSQHTSQQQQQQQAGQQEVKYVSANCMVVTNYAGDTATVVDEHFTRALSTPTVFEKPHNSPGKASSPMSSRNFPPSFWDSHYQAPSTSSAPSSRPPSLASHLPGATDLYDPYHGGLHSLQAQAHDPWAAYSLSSQAYGHRSMAHDVYQAAMSSVPSSSRPYHQYSSLSFQPHLPRIPGVSSQMSMGKHEGWGARYHDAFANPELAAAHGLDTTYTPAHYTNVPGLETGVPQDGTKDLYWF